MPNWVRTKVYFGKGEVGKTNMEYVKSTYGTEGESGEIDLDFNKIVPMPEDLMIEKSSKSRDALQMYVYMGQKGLDAPTAEKVIDAYANTLDSEYDTIEIDDETYAKLLDKYKDEASEMLKLGSKVAHNIITYGCTDWYEWRIENWGTKWNGSTVKWDEDDIGWYVLMDTAWYVPFPIILKLSEMFPNKHMACMYSDETSEPCGTALFCNGKIDFNITERSMDSDCKDKIHNNVWGE